MTANPFGALYDGTGQFRVDVDTGERTWSTNALTFATMEEAEAYARDLHSRWRLVRHWRVVLSSTPKSQTVERDAAGTA